MQKYLTEKVRDIFHAPFATILKGAVVLSDVNYSHILPVVWELLIDDNQELAAAAASLFILAAVRIPNIISEFLCRGLQDDNAQERINTILKFQILWKSRYQIWPRLEEMAHVTFKVPPPGIEFTLPSPKIGIESLPVVDPPWMPQVKTKVEEVTINQERHRALVTTTKTRKKQQTELIRKALKEQDDKKRQERENFLITTIPINFQAAFEPSPLSEEHDEGNVDEESIDVYPRAASHHGQFTSSLFPSSLCSAIIYIIDLLNDASTSADGHAVYEVAYQVIWNCLVEDSALFLRFVLEKITREKQEEMFKLLRHLIRFVPKLPQQAAFALYNFIIGYIMFYVRAPNTEANKFIGGALSILWMVVHSVHGIMFKDLKQILRKEQCDASVLLTANVPSAKKIIVHGPQDPDAGGIPSQFPIQEDTQFSQILRESLEFFGIEETKHKEHFLKDHRTHQICNPSSYVRDFYFFKRSQYPQLDLVYMEPSDAFTELQCQELEYKFVEIGKVLLTWAILKNVDMVVQRVVFLHEELIKLPSFPRKALEAHLFLYEGGVLGKQLLSLDVMHKFMWVRLIARMFEAMAGNFAYSGDIHLFLNVLNGALILHSQDCCILRYVIATYINAAHNFKNIFATNGYLLIMPPLLQLYSSYQHNHMVKVTIEYATKQFYLMNRKPFILQMFGSVAAILDTDNASSVGEAHKLPSNCLFNLLLSLETPSPDPLSIGELVKEEKPLKAIDFCYHDENEMVTVLDCISLCVMVVAYAPDSLRAQQMLTILEAILPCYVQKIQSPTYTKDERAERDILIQLSTVIRTLVNNTEALSKLYNRPQKLNPELKASSQKNYLKYSQGIDFDDDFPVTKYLDNLKNTKINHERDNDDSEKCYKEDFRKSRGVLLNLVGEFVSLCSKRLAEIKHKLHDGKPVEVLDSKCHVRLADVAHSLLKLSPYDPESMACNGLKRYMNDILPSASEWVNDDMRSALTLILRRLDKTFNKIYKKTSIRRNINWNAAADILGGVYKVLEKCPYIAHFQNLKTLLSTCQSLIIGDTTQIEITSTATAAIMSKMPPSNFSSIVLKLIALQVVALGDGYTLEYICGGYCMFSSTAKTENILLNLFIPLFLHVGIRKQGAPNLRQSDVCFGLTVVLNTLWPPGARAVNFQTSTVKGSADVRAGSLTFSRDSKTLTKISHSLYRVAFLALKVIVSCFQEDLTTEWMKIVRTIRLLNKRNEASIFLWNFLDFNVSYRTPLFIFLLPFTTQKLLQTPISEHERHIQIVIRDKINGIHIQMSKSDCLHDLKQEFTVLKDELEERRIYELQPESKRSIVETNSGNDEQTRLQRPSLLIDFFSGDNSSRVINSRNKVNSPVQSLSSQQQGSNLNITTHENKTINQACQIGSKEEDQDTNNDRLSKPRLQRSLGESKRTFRVRKYKGTTKVLEALSGTENNEEKESIEKVKCSSPLQGLPQGVLATCASSCPPSKHSQVEASVTTSESLQSAAQSSSQFFRQYPPVRSQSDVSWDEDTSSTSGYKESYSLHLESLESNCNSQINNFPPLASPDQPSMSSAAVNNERLDETSPELSMNGSGDEKTILLTQSSQRSASQHSLLLVYQSQDEDTLI